MKHINNPVEKKPRPKDDDNRPAEDLQALEQEELSGNDGDDESLESSDTDEDENEGVGDGNIGGSGRVD